MKTLTAENHRYSSAPWTLVPACQKHDAQADWFPSVDVLEDEEEYVFVVDLPEMKAEEVRVAVEKGELFISGTRPVPGRGGRRCLRIERPYGYFERRFALPDAASRVEIDACSQEGVLQLHVRKLRPLNQDRLALRDFNRPNNGSL